MRSHAPNKSLIKEKLRAQNKLQELNDKNNVIVDLIRTEFNCEAFNLDFMSSDLLKHNVHKEDMTISEYSSYHLERKKSD